MPSGRPVSGEEFPKTMENMTKLTVCITGSTSGIGRATAVWLARSGHRLILCGRREERLSELAAELGGDPGVHLLRFDVRDRTAVEQAIGQIPEAFRPVDVLINNAGNAHGLDPIDRGSPDDWDAMLDGNVKGLLYVTRALVEDLKRSGRGQIINIGSIAGKEVYPGGNVYCASKFAVDALTQSMRMDLLAYGIRVGAINPGMVQTEFSEVRFKGDLQRAEAVYSSLQPLQAQDIAEIIEFTITRPPHVNIADLLVLPTAQASASIIHRK